MSDRPQWKRDVGPHGTRRRVRALCRRLDKAYGPFVAKPRRAPLDGLILTVLSQATSDRNSDTAYARLKERFPSWSLVLSASRSSLEEAIRPGGLAYNKSQTIRNILTTLEQRSGGLPPEVPDPLSHLADTSVDEAMKELTSLPGVGLKTAACVLMFCHGRPVMPVDTHVHRLSARLGLVRSKATADQTHHVLMKITPSELIYPFHVWLITHGRTTCRAQNPRCDGCRLKGLCPSTPN